MWTQRMLAALVNGVKGGKWYSPWDKVTDRRRLEASWEGVARNNGAAGLDRVSVERCASGAERYLDERQAELPAGRYRPRGVKRTYLPKAGGGRRPLGIPTVKDRRVQGALKRVLEPICEWECLDGSDGFRPGRGAKDALRAVDDARKRGATWVVDADLQGDFDSIPHRLLMEEDEARISDGRGLALIDAYLQADIVEGLAHWTPTRGTPQGAVLRPLLANLYRHGRDRRLREQGYGIVRDADDFVLACTEERQAQAALQQVQAWCEERQLTLHPAKTHLGDCRQVGEGLAFLGCRCEAGRRWVGKKSRKAIRERIRAKTRRNRGGSLASIIAGLNPVLTGRFGYCKHACHWEFPALDGCVRRRWRAILRRHQHRPGRLGQSRQDHTRWPNAFFAAHGLFTRTEAHALASRSR